MTKNNNWLKESVKSNSEHIAVLNEEMAYVKTDVRWIKYLIMPILGGVGALVFKVYLG